MHRGTLSQLKGFMTEVSALAFHAVVIVLSAGIAWSLPNIARQFLIFWSHVEQEKMLLLEYLHKEFNNRTIMFDVLVDAGEKEDVPVHMRLNSKQKFEYIAEQYPLVKELKERLKLEIDY